MEGEVAHGTDKSLNPSKVFVYKVTITEALSFLKKLCLLP